jgi:transposase
LFYLLKESFGQLCDYRTERGARTFFERRRDGLKWQRLVPYAKFAKRIERHGEGIASYCHRKNKISLGLMEGLNNKIRVIQRRAYGLPGRGVFAAQDHRCVSTAAAPKGSRRPTVIREDP